MDRNRQTVLSGIGAPFGHVLLGVLGLRRAPAWVVTIAVICAVLGTWFRFSHLETKYYFFDEMYSALHVAGYTVAELSAYAPHRAIAAGDFVRKFQMPGPGRGPGDTVRVLAQSDASHPPLYYLLERGTEELFGDSFAARRVLAAVAGLLLLPAVFWLCIELFGSALVAWVAVAVVAVSPYQVVFSQQVREWTLFDVFATAAVALMVRGLRTGSVVVWAAYTIALICTLYSAILSIFVLMALVIFVLVRSRVYERRNLAAFWIGTSVAFVSFLPWLATLAAHWREATRTNQWAATALPLKLYLAKIVFALASVFFDAEYLNVRLAVVLLPVAIAVVYGVWLFLRRAPAEGKALVASLFCVTALGFLFSDALLHASRAAQQRYLVTAFLALQIGVACGFALGLVQRSASARAVAATLLAIVLIAEASSTAIGSGQRSWWANNDAAQLAAAAGRLEADPTSVVVTNPFVGIQLANALPPNALLAFDLPSALQSGAPVLYALDPGVQVVAQLRAAERQPGERVDVAVREQQALRAVHANVAQAHGVSISYGEILWRFDNRVH